MVREIRTSLARYLKITLVLGMISFLVVSFQNCGDAQFSSIEDGVNTKTSDTIRTPEEVGVVDPDLPREDSGTTDPDAPNEESDATDDPMNGSDPLPDDNPEFIVAGTCDFDNLAPIPNYDTSSYKDSVDIYLEKDKNVVVAEAKEASLAIIKGSVQATHIGHISNVAIVRDADIVNLQANSVGSLAIARAKQFDISAQTVESLALDRAEYDAEGLQGITRINAHSVNNLTLLKFGKICVSTNDLENMAFTKGSLDIRGFEKDGVQARVGSITYHRGAIYLKDVIVEEMSFVRGTIYLDNAQINSLSFQREGDIVLKNGSPEPGHMYSVKGEIQRM